ncbi:tRNA (adenosine(37)-N6)-threonylcarbamoyltransferase complex dimerization subunit type 1 TsaB [Candidatus Sumerlaeota bacterium]|nr:tRNA (adenosine(37)-N6)-threonylcarbamoyltransferase complex dimerization subunit type 1 TsaB [Candidatus Sumerlaeota bacterium]
MRILGIDSATSCGGIAIIEDNMILASLVLNVKKTHSERLLKNIDYLLGECGVQIMDIDGVAVSIGPGSFTGIRIGMACAKGLAYSSGKPLVGVSLLDAIALRNAEPGILVCPVLDARRNEIFGAAYKMEAETRKMKETLPGRAEPLVKFLENIREKALFCGDGAFKFKETIEKTLGEKAIIAPANRNLPSAVEIAMIGMERLVRGEKDDIAGLAPLYLRAHDARLPSNTGIKIL